MSSIKDLPINKKSNKAIDVHFQKHDNQSAQSISSLSSHIEYFKS